MCAVALIVTADGTRFPVGLRQGDTEDDTLVKILLAVLMDRGLGYSSGLPVAADRTKSLASVVTSAGAASTAIWPAGPTRVGMREGLRASDGC